VTKSPRTRLDPQERRAQLVELGLQMLSSRPLDKVAIDDIAAEAGISRGLLFHYFPTKRDYHIAVAQAAAQEMLDRTDPPAELPPAERLRTAVAAFVDHVTENRDAYVRSSGARRAVTPSSSRSTSGRVPRSPTA
jgi:AcrR family transcriptional regulator